MTVAAHDRPSWEALLAATVAGQWSAEALVTLYVALDFSSGTCTIPAPHVLAPVRQCSVRTIQRHFDELRAAGLFDAFPLRCMPSPRLQLLKDEAVAAMVQNAAAVAKRRAKPARVRTPSPRSPVPALLELFVERVVRMPATMFRPAYGTKELAQIKRLLAALPGGVDDATAVIEKVTNSAVWADARQHFGIIAELPTPGILLGFGGSLVPWLLAHGKARRTGGAVLTTTEKRIDPETGLRTF